MGLVNVAVNGIWLDTLSSKIIVNDVDEKRVRMQHNATSYGNGIGQYLINSERQYLEVSVKFCIRIKPGTNEMIERNNILRKVCQWANQGGKLMTTYRSDMYLDVMCAEFPEIGKAKDWTKEYEVVFRAYEIPYWQSVSPTIGHITNYSSTLFSVNGNVPSPLTFIITYTESKTNTNITITSLNNNDKITLSGFSVSATDLIYLKYDGHKQLIMLDTGNTQTDAAKYRTVDSSDDLRVNPNNARFKVTGDISNTSITLSTRGWWY